MTRFVETTKHALKSGFEVVARGADGNVRDERVLDPVEQLVCDNPYFGAEESIFGKVDGKVRHI